MGDRHDEQLFLMFPIDDLEGVTAKQVVAMPLVAKRKPLRIRGGRFQGAIELRLESFGRPLSWLGVSAKGPR